MSPLDPQPRFILVDTSHPGNVGAAARAIKVMGFGDLVLVRPRFADVLSREETVAMASGGCAGRRSPGVRYRHDTPRLRAAGHVAQGPFRVAAR
jgi:hypothetical protein